MDGRHRIVKALLNKENFIKAVRFKKTPDCDEYVMLFKTFEK